MDYLFIENPTEILVIQVQEDGLEEYIVSPIEICF